MAHYTNILSGVINNNQPNINRRPNMVRNNQHRQINLAFHTQIKSPEPKKSNPVVVKKPAVIVKEPVVTTLATADPYTVPVIPEATTAAFAGPPVLCPVSATAKSTKNLPTPDLIKIPPNIMNRTM